ncbi:MAG TPA: sialidase family protein [Candidatus Thermoplasmatota archaeon]|nr:sialidase family protein [Candidatus Thermoplasmatota archaeon]
MRAVLAACLLALLLAPSLLAVGPDAFPANVRVTTSNGPANEVHIAVDPNNAQRLVAGAKDYTLGASNACGVTRVWAGAYASSDGGATWGNTLVPGYPGSPTPSALSAYGCSSDPVVAFDGLGLAHYLGIAINGPGQLNALWTATSPDGGASWPVIATHMTMPGQAWFNDKEWFAFDPVLQIAYVTWTVFPAVGLPGVSGIWMLRCVLGQACGPPQPIGFSPLGQCGSAQGSYPVVGPDHEVYVVWTSFGPSGICFAKSTDLGTTFSAPRIISTASTVNGQPNTAFRSLTMPAMAVDTSAGPTRGNLYVVWHDRRYDSSDVLMVRSTDGGATWTAAQKVNDDPPGKSNFMPAIGVAPDGRVDVAFYDRRDDPANRLLTVYLASSTDGGATFPNERVSSAQFNGDLGRHQGGFAFIGDYIGVASSADRAVPIWADTRDGTSQAYVALVPR